MITYILIGINVVVYYLTYTNKLDRNNYYLSYYEVSVRKQYYRLLTSGFFHGDIMHLLCNMYSLFNIGRLIENLYGSVLFLIIYLVITIIGGLLSIIVKHNNYNDNVGSIGASGAICGLIGIYFVKIFKIYGLRAISSLLPSLLPMIVISFMPGVDLYGHLFGFVVGGLISFII